MKKILIALLLSSGVHAAPYVEYKNEYDVQKEMHVNHVRGGYKWDNNFYVEAGKMTEGWGSEIGYKWKQDNWELKGKFETKKKNEHSPNSKLETELRYTFK